MLLLLEYVFEFQKQTLKGIPTSTPAKHPGLRVLRWLWAVEETGHNFQMTFDNGPIELY